MTASGEGRVPLGSGPRATTVRGETSRATRRLALGVLAFLLTAAFGADVVGHALTRHDPTCDPQRGFCIALEVIVLFALGYALVVAAIGVTAGGVAIRYAAQRGVRGVGPLVRRGLAVTVLVMVVMAFFLRSAGGLLGL